LISVPSTEKCSKDSSCFSCACDSTASKKARATSLSSRRSRFFAKVVGAQTTDGGCSIRESEDHESFSILLKLRRAQAEGSYCETRQPPLNSFFGDVC